jgi:hypothetical protein
MGKVTRNGTGKRVSDGEEREGGYYFHFVAQALSSS